MNRLKIVLLQFLLIAFQYGHAFAFTGAVVDQNGNGVENSTVIITAGSNEYIVYSGSNGLFNVDLPSNTNFTVQALKSGYGETSGSGNSNDSSPMRLTLELQTVELSGKVMTTAGDPIAFAIVNGGSLGVRVTNANGEFSFTAQYGQTYALTTSSMDMYFAQTISGKLEGDTQRTIVGIEN